MNADITSLLLTQGVLGVFAIVAGLVIRNMYNELKLVNTKIETRCAKAEEQRDKLNDDIMNRYVTSLDAASRAIESLVQMKDR